MFRFIEVKRILLVATACCVITILSTSAFLFFSSQRNLKNMTARMQDAMAVQLAEHIKVSFKELTERNALTPLSNGALSLEELLEKPDETFSFLISAVRAACNGNSAALFVQNELVAASFMEGAGESPPSPQLVSTNDDFAILDSYDDQAGCFIVLSKPGFMPGQQIVIVINNTSQIEQISKTFNRQKSSMLKSQLMATGLIYAFLSIVSLIIILYTIRKYLSNPLRKLADSAQLAISGESIKGLTVEEGSIFTNLNRLLKSGKAILEKAVVPERKACHSEKSEKRGGREIRKVAIYWILFTGALCAVIVSVILIVSISIMNSKMDEIRDNVAEAMANYYSKAYDSDLSYVKASKNVFVSSDFYNADVERDRSSEIENMYGLLRATYDADMAAFVTRTEEGFEWIAAEKRGAPLYSKKEALGDDVRVERNMHNEGDLILFVKADAFIPGYSKDSQALIIADITEQALELEKLNKAGRKSLFGIHLAIIIIFSIIAAILTPIGLGYALERYITKPIVELDELSERIMGGSFYEKIQINSDSAFADMHILLKAAQDVLREIPFDYDAD